MVAPRRETKETLDEIHVNHFRGKLPPTQKLLRVGKTPLKREVLSF